MFGLQTVHRDEPAADQKPAPQRVHDDMPAAPWTQPAGQLTQAAAPDEEYLPGLHCRQPGDAGAGAGGGGPGGGGGALSPM